MKTIKILSAAALILGMASCDNFDLPNPGGQSYPEPDGFFQNSDLVISQAPESAVNLVDANAANKYVTVGTITTLNNFPAGYELVIDMELAANDQFSKFTTVSTVIDGDNITVNPDVLNGAIQEAITKKPGTYPVATRFIAYAVKDNTRMRLGGLNGFYGTDTALTVTTLDAAKVLEDLYYLVPIDEQGTTPNWTAALPMINTAGVGVSPYDNPEFSVKFEVPADNAYYFTVAPESVFKAQQKGGLMGANMAADGTSGKLAVGYAPGRITLIGDVLMTINVEQDAVSVNYAFPSLYPFSGATQASQVMQLVTDNYINYYGVTAINQRWTLGAQPDKTGPVIFGVDAEVEPEVSEDGLSQSGALKAGAASTDYISSPVKGNTLFWVNVNLVQLTYDMHALQTLTVIGGGNGWNLETAQPLTPSRDLRIWTGSDIEIEGEFKINANRAWDYDFGGDLQVDVTGGYAGTLQFKGSNLGGMVAGGVEKGKYDVTVNFSTVPYTISLVKKN